MDLITPTVLSLANNTLKETKEVRVGFWAFVGYEYLGGKKLEISKGKTKVIVKNEQEKVQIKFDLLDKPLFEQKIISKFEKANKKIEYKNLFSVFHKVTEYLLPNQNNLPKNTDNLKILFDECKNISEEQMQEKIAQIIAQEYNFPNSISRQTIRKVESLTIKEINLFEKYASLLWFAGGEYHLLGDFFSDHRLYKPLDLNFIEFNELQCLGLFNPVNLCLSFSFNQNLSTTNVTSLKYNNQQFLFSTQLDKLEIPNVYTLSTVGKQLLKHVIINENQEFYDWSITKFNEKSLTKLE